MIFKNYSLYSSRKEIHLKNKIFFVNEDNFLKEKITSILVKKIMLVSLLFNILFPIDQTRAADRQTSPLTREFSQRVSPVKFSKQEVAILMQSQINAEKAVMMIKTMHKNREEFQENLKNLCFACETQDPAVYQKALNKIRAADEINNGLEIRFNPPSPPFYSFQYGTLRDDQANFEDIDDIITPP